MKTFLTSYFFNILFILFLIQACNGSDANKSRPQEKITLLAYLPFESANYYEDTNFTLYDSAGKKCIALLDTVTIGGGHVEYDSLLPGMYKFLINTIFEDSITRYINLDSSETVDLSPNYFYHSVEAIEIDSLQMAKKIKLIILKDEKKYSLEINKQDTQYQVMSNDFEGKTKNIIIDSSIIIKRLLDFEIVMSGCKAAGIKQDKIPFFTTPQVYMKADNNFSEFFNIREDYLMNALNKLIK